MEDSSPVAVSKNTKQAYQSGTLPFSVALRELPYTVTPFERATVLALRELPYTVTPFERATENGSSGH